MRSGGGAARLLGRRAHQHDPLYQVRGLHRHGAEHLTEPQQAKISVNSTPAIRPREVDLAWQGYQQLRSIYTRSTGQGRQIAIKV
jgi:hypothetical protein